MNNEFLAQLDYLGQERGISREVLIDAIEKALMSASKKSIHPATNVEIKIDRNNGEIKAIAQLEIVEKNPNDDQIILDGKVRRVYPSAKIGDVIAWEVTPRNFGRIAAQTARQVIMQQLRKAEKAIVQEEFKDRVGQIVGGVVRRFEAGKIIVDMQKAEGLIDKKEQLPGEKYIQGDRINALLMAVESGGSGPSLILSRSSPDFVVRLFEREVSEIHDGIVTIKAVAREPGSRTKIAVHSSDAHVDPIGACVGMRGMRVKNVTNELSGEKIDIVKFDEDVRVFAANALQPAAIKGIELDEPNHTINISVAADQLSLAIGKRGQNVRLTSKLLGWKVNINESKEEATFAEKLEQTIASLGTGLQLDIEIARKLVSAGYLTIDALSGAGKDELKIIDGLSGEDIEKILAAVAKKAASKDAAKQDDDSKKQ